MDEDLAKADAFLAPIVASVKGKKVPTPEDWKTWLKVALYMRRQKSHCDQWGRLQPTTWATIAAYIHKTYPAAQIYSERTLLKHLCQLTKQITDDTAI